MQYVSASLWVETTSNTSPSHHTCSLLFCVAWFCQTFATLQASCFSALSILSTHSWQARELCIMVCWDSSSTRAILKC